MVKGQLVRQDVKDQKGNRVVIITQPDGSHKIRYKSAAASGSKRWIWVKKEYCEDIHKAIMGRCTFERVLDLANPRATRSARS